MFDAYTKELFLFDQHYRLFNERAEIAEKAGWDVLMKIVIVGGLWINSL